MMLELLLRVKIKIKQNKFLNTNKIVSHLIYIHTDELN